MLLKNIYDGQSWYFFVKFTKQNEIWWNMSKMINKENIDKIKCFTKADMEVYLLIKNWNIT